MLNVSAVTIVELDASQRSMQKCARLQNTKKCFLRPFGMTVLPRSCVFTLYSYKRSAGCDVLSRYEGSLHDGAGSGMPIDHSRVR